MAMELEFWLPDGPNGEVLDFARPVSMGTLVPAMDRYWTKHHAYAIVKHTSRQRPEEWCIRVKPGYTSGTAPCVGKIEGVK